MSESETVPYYRARGANWSTLKHLRESALHYRYLRDMPSKTTPAMALGRATHTLVFEPEKFNEEYAIWEGGDRRGTAWKEYQEANEGRIIFKPAEIDIAVQISDAVRRHPLVQPYLVDGVFEQPVFWTDPDTGIACKAKPDWMQPERRVLVDLKTTQSIHARRFGAQAASFGYHLQCAMYAMGIEGALGWKPAKVCIIAVESKPPYDVAIFEIDRETLMLAEVEVKELLMQLKACRTADSWPGRYIEEQALQLPAWVYGSDDEDDPESFGLALQETV
jgi:hypothetical protein